MTTHEQAGGRRGDGTPRVVIEVFGTPGPQGSKTHLGRGRMVESSKKVKPWRQDVKQAALAVTGQAGGWRPLDGPLAVSMVFSLTRPAGHRGTGRNAGSLRASAPARPTTYPDLSKLARSTEDALTGVVWADDARVVEYVRLGKWYAGTPGVPDMLGAPGCVIRVWSLPAAGGAPQPEHGREAGSAQPGMFLPGVAG
jgi:Holliday junction resolvase RusA-like endonuclease